MAKRSALLGLLGILLLAWAALAAAQTSDQPLAPAADQPAAATADQPAAPSAEQPLPKPATQPAMPPRPGRPGIGHGGLGPAPGRFYDPNTVATLAGEVVQVQRGPVGPRGKVDLVRFTLKTPQGPVEVMLGPATYVDAQALKLAAGDQVEVKGSRQTTPRGRPFLSAAAVKKGSQVLKLRDEKGNPLWPPPGGGQGRRSPAPQEQ